MSTPQGLRCRSDLRLHEQLRSQYSIKRAIESFEKKLPPSETRRKFLASSIRLTPGLAPELHRIVDHCKEALAFEMPLEIFVYPSASYNAAAARPEDGRGFVLLASSLLEAFEDDELAYVIGHELGHHVFKHHDIPVGALLSSKAIVSPAQALQLFSWSRFAEISADRAGIYCCKDLDAAGRALFKLASGLEKPLTKEVVTAMLEQMGDIEAHGGPKSDEILRSDWISTHPFSPLRIKAGKLFCQSKVMQDQGTALDELETEVEELLQVMEIGYLRANTDEAKALRRFLLAAGMIIADTSGRILDEESEALNELLGEGTVTKELNVEALRDDLDRRVADVVERSQPGPRLQVLRDLVLVARADGEVCGEERLVLETFARQLQLDPKVIGELIESEFELD